MNPAATCLCCDWGTSSFRLSWVNRETGTVMASIKAAAGIKAVFQQYQQEKKEDSEQEREDFFRIILATHIGKLAQQTKQSLSGIPLIISGMASSSIGIRELPYSLLPLTTEGKEIQAEWLYATATLPHDILLISGVKSETDVMRGEEIQWLGLTQVLDIQSGTCLLPGTHSKHLRIEAGQLVDFKTYMTGELFHLLHSHSILRMPAQEIFVNSWDSLQEQAFCQGVELGAQENLLHALFQVRTRELLEKTSAEQRLYFLSGITIGSELSAWNPQVPTSIWLVGGGSLSKLYRLALKVLGWESHTTLVEPKTTETLAIRGQLFVLNQKST